MVSLAACALAVLAPASAQTQPQMLSTGKLITPIGTHQEVTQYPVNMVKIPGTHFAVVTGVGYQEYLSVVDIRTGKVLDQVDYKTNRSNPDNIGLYFGLAVHPKTGEVFAARGAEDKVTAYKVSADGKLTETRTISNVAPKDRKMPYFFAGLAFNSNGSRLMVVNNETAQTTDFKGSISVYQTDTGKELFQIPTSGFPLNCTYLTLGKFADRKAYVCSERDGVLDIIDLRSKSKTGTIKIGASPVGMLLNADQSKLFVANAGSDTVSVVDTRTDKVVDTISLRPNQLRGLPGAGPTGLELSPDEKTLFVTLGDMNALAVVNLRTRNLQGYIPTGWLPTAVVQQNDSLLVTSAKGVTSKHPNPIDPGKTSGPYIQNLIPGTVSHFTLSELKNLRRDTAQVIKNNRLRSGLDTAKLAGFKNPGITHVIYVIKENRTYDNVLGDIKKGNGDPKQTLFPRAVTPNLHALAERFVLLDNFYVCAEVSQDGWVWSTAGMINPYGSRNTVYNYSGRGRNYDTEGQNNGVPVDLLGIPDVTRPASGYIWENCHNNGVTYRNYGMFSVFLDPTDKRFTTLPGAVDNYPAKKLLESMSDRNFLRYDLSYADSELTHSYGWTWPGQKLTFGEHKSPSRFTEWKREFDQFVAKGEMPRFQMIRFGTDHTQGTRKGAPTPQAMVADNDYAVGQLVEAVSHSPFWKSTVICVLEDDAQAGYDHVDAHRSTAYVISPYIKRGLVDSTFYNTDSMLRTMCLLLGMPPMSQYDAVATPMNIFGPTASNAEPYVAVRAAKEIACQTNDASAYRSKDSEKISLHYEESGVDEGLNDILWGSIKGAKTPRPQVRRGLFFKELQRDDD